MRVTARYLYFIYLTENMVRVPREIRILKLSSKIKKCSNYKMTFNRVTKVNFNVFFQQRPANKYLERL